jgi:hypothetical protein
MNSLHNLPNSYHRTAERFLPYPNSNPNPNRDRTLFRTIDSRRWSAIGLPMLPNPDRRRHHFPDIVMR